MTSFMSVVEDDNDHMMQDGIQSKSGFIKLNQRIVQI